MNSPSRPPSSVPRGGVVMLKSRPQRPGPGFFGSLGAVAVGCSIAMGCSSSTTLGTGVNCGPGTKLVEEVCVPDEDAATGQDSTRDDASSEEAKGEAGIDASLSDSMTKPDTAISPDAAKDVKPDTASTSDECPMKVPGVNCSSTCVGSGILYNCERVRCGASPVGMVIVKDADLPYYLRTPEKPGVDPLCPTGCSGGSLAYAMRVKIATSGTTVKITVGAPWAVYDATGAPFCPGPAHGQCWTALADYEFLVGTTDPKAPARNVLLQEVPYGTKCI